MYFAVVLVLMSSSYSSCAITQNMHLAIIFRNFTNLDGTIADGTCCDNETLNAPNCPDNQCDTAFKICATRDVLCDSSSNNTWIAPTMNRNSFIIGDRMGDGNGSTSSLHAFPLPYSSVDIELTITAGESSENKTTVEIAVFRVTIDWMEPFFSTNPDWHQLSLTTGNARLGIDVARQCYRNYYGETCSIFCSPTDRYTCLNNGSKSCLPGWSGADCDVEFSCSDGLCLNGGTCELVSGGYKCNCPRSASVNTYYSWLFPAPTHSPGKNCENVVLAPSTTTTTTIMTTSSTSASKTTSTISSKRTSKSSTASILTGIFIGISMTTNTFTSSSKGQGPSTSRSPSTIPSTAIGTATTEMLASTSIPSVKSLGHLTAVTTEETKRSQSKAHPKSTAVTISAQPEIGFDGFDSQNKTDTKAPPLRTDIFIFVGIVFAMLYLLIVLGCCICCLLAKLNREKRKRKISPEKGYKCDKTWESDW